MDGVTNTGFSRQMMREKAPGVGARGSRRARGSSEICLPVEPRRCHGARTRKRANRRRGAQRGAQGPGEARFAHRAQSPDFHPVSLKARRRFLAGAVGADARYWQLSAMAMSHSALSMNPSRFPRRQRLAQSEGKVLVLLQLPASPLQGPGQSLLCSRALAAKGKTKHPFCDHWESTRYP